ncbi:hypothetical protein [Bifidobacterium pseudolongum]|nr:hypothetical protein [Bifidobacterium pseudolongum]
MAPDDPLRLFPVAFLLSSRITELGGDIDDGAGEQVAGTIIGL